MKKNIETGILNTFSGTGVSLRTVVQNTVKHIEQNLRTCFADMSIGDFFKKQIYINPYTQVGGDRQDIEEIYCTDRRYIVVGEAGSGKSMLLFKYYFGYAQQYLADTTGTIAAPLLVQCKNIQHSHKDLLQLIDDFDHELTKLPEGKYVLFIDGLDELQFAAPVWFVEQIKKHTHFITCRDYVYEKYLHVLDTFSVVKICKWNKDRIDKLVECFFCHNKELESYKQKIRHLVFEQIDEISPLTLSLMLYAIDEHSIHTLIEGKNLELDAFELFLQKFCLREKQKNGTLCECSQQDLQKILDEGVWLFKYAQHEGDVVDFDQLCKRVKQTVGGDVTEKNVETMLKSVFWLPESTFEDLTLNLHHKIVEFIVARFVYRIIVANDLRNISLNYPFRSEILGFLRKMLYLRKGRASEWIKAKLEISSPHFLEYGFYIFVCRFLDITEAESLILGRLKNEKSYAYRTILYDQLIQLPLSVDVKIKYERMYFNELVDDLEFLRWDIGSRLCYVGNLEYAPDGLPVPDDGYCKWDKLLKKYRKHFEEKRFDDIHYILRRIELFIIKYLFQSHTAWKDVRVEAVDFLRKLPIELQDNADINNAEQSFNMEVLHMYNSLLSLIN